MKIREQQLDLIHGDSTQELAAFRDNSFDALVTDPPAGIAFLNKQWDSDKGGRDQWVAWLSTILKECYRVLKPGAHGLIWSIPRTSHWAAWAAEDAGFDILNVVTHIFGTGFPKGLDLSKALDKVNAEPGRELKFTKWMRTTGLTIAKINDITGTFMGSHYLTDKSQPAIPTRELWVKLRPFCGNVPAWVDTAVVAQSQTTFFYVDYSESCRCCARIYANYSHAIFLLLIYGPPFCWRLSRLLFYFLFWPYAIFSKMRLFCPSFCDLSGRIFL